MEKNAGEISCVKFLTLTILNNREEEPNHGRANLEDKLVEERLEEDRLEDRQETCLRLGEVLQQEENLHLQAGNTGQRDVEEDRQTRGMGGKWMRGNTRTLPKQMVVILSPKKDIFDEVTTTMLEDAVDKGNKSLIFEIIRKIQKEQMKSMNKKKTRINKDGLNFKRETDDTKDMKDAITNILDSFLATYDDPMVRIDKSQYKFPSYLFT